MTNTTPTTRRKPVVARGASRRVPPSDRTVDPGYRAVIYLRVSTAGQLTTTRDGEGFSISAQRDACYRKAEAMGANVVEEYIDAGESARSADRAQLQAMLARLGAERDIDFVIVHKVDRLARNRADDVQINLAIREAGAKLVSVSENIDETPSGMLLAGIMSSIAEFYSLNLASEITKGMNQKAKKGGYPHRAPIGFLNKQDLSDGNNRRWIEPDPDRGPLVSWAFEAYASGDYSIRQLAEALEAKGLVTRPTKGSPAKVLTSSRLQALLKNRFYVGLVVWGGVEYRGEHQPLISIETFATVQALMESRARSREKPSKHTHYLKGSLFCGRCQTSMGFVRATGRSGEQYDYFFCWSRAKNGGCDLPYIDADVIEEKVAAYYDTIQLAESTTELIREKLTQFVRLVSAGATKAAAKARKRIATLEDERRSLLQAHYAGAVPLELLKEEQDRITKQIAQQGVALANTEVDFEVFDQNLTAALKLASRFGDAYYCATPASRRQLNQGVFEAIYIDHPGIVGVKLADPMAQLLADDLVARLEEEIAKPTGIHHVGGSRLNPLVEVSGLEPPTSTLRT